MYASVYSRRQVVVLQVYVCVYVQYVRIYACMIPMRVWE